MAIYKASVLRKKLQHIQTYVKNRALERELETDSAIVSILSGASCFFLGDAGAGKTYHIELLAKLMSLTLFDTLISQSTKPDALFGPPDVPALAKGIQRNKIEGYVPTAELVFFDEIFKANDIVLNPLLWFMNEHKYRNGDDGIIRCPVLGIFAASNEVPTAKGDRPIYDRFIIRHEVQYIKSHRNLHKLMDLGDLEEEAEIEKLSRKEVKILRQFVQKVKFSHELWDTVIKIRDQVQNSVGVRISDRRLKWTVPVVKAHAFLHGRKDATPQDLEMLAHMFWDTAEQARKVRTIVFANCSAEKGDILSYTETAESIYEKAVKTGDFADGLRKLRDLAKVTKQLIDSTTGKQVHIAVMSLLRQVKNVLTSREEITVFSMTDADGKPWLKLSEACANVWTSDQLRSVGFKYRRSLGYWWRPLKKSDKAYLQFTKQVSTKLKAKVEKKGLI